MCRDKEVRHDPSCHDVAIDNPDQDKEAQTEEVMKGKNRSLGAADVPLTTQWIQDQVSKGCLPVVGLKENQRDTSWSKIRSRTEESEPDPVKSNVSPTDYEKAEVEAGKAFYLGRTLDEEERTTYSRLLKEFFDVFAWAPSDLKGISPELG